ncbi:Cytochrome c' [Kingella potus]|uniref:Cytochrome c n=1 Tax=Kingella potus TaxID=265175 RepID=A0A377QYY0_9NEIS|nr:cytochrome c [Kingella potus]UOP01467.1 cytochrome c [Kingella potus]STR00217.1 Cytochrome c' [Kingella potus]
MNTRIPALLSAAALALALAACGGEPAEPKGGISARRTAAFKEMMPEFAEMGKTAKGDQAYDPDAFRAAAAVFAAKAQEPFLHFQNDPEGNGRALPQIWQQEEAFGRERDGFLAAVAELNAKAQKGNLQEIKAAYDAADASCQSCHRAYRRPR